MDAQGEMSLVTLDGGFRGMRGHGDSALSDAKC